MVGAQINGAGTLMTLATRVRNRPRRWKGHPQGMNRWKPIATVVEVVEGEICWQHLFVFPDGSKEMVIGVGSGKLT